MNKKDLSEQKKAGSKNKRSPKSEHRNQYAF
jgi:hypothetical protein